MALRISSLLTGSMAGNRSSFTGTMPCLLQVMHATRISKVLVLRVKGSIWCSANGSEVTRMPPIPHRHPIPSAIQDWLR